MFHLLQNDGREDRDRVGGAPRREHEPWGVTASCCGLYCNSAHVSSWWPFTIICSTSADYHAWIIFSFLTVMCLAVNLEGPIWLWCLWLKQPFIFYFPAQMTNRAALSEWVPLFSMQWRGWPETSAAYWEAPSRHWGLAPHICHSKNLGANARTWLFLMGYMFSLPPTPFPVSVVVIAI